MVGFCISYSSHDSSHSYKEIHSETGFKTNHIHFCCSYTNRHPAYSILEIEKILEKKGKSLNSCFTLNMGCNDPRDKDYRPATKEEIAKLESEVQNRLDSIQKIITNRENSREEGSELIPASRGLGRLVRLGMSYAEHNGAKNYFYTNSRCKGCGKCEKVCLFGIIKMIDNKPVWQESVKCYFCYACLNYCPVKAVQIKSKFYMKSYTEENERYSHPYAIAEEIAEKSGRKLSSVLN